MVLIPQAIAYAELAGLPPQVGLFASAAPLLVASLFTSSRYLQTGPVAMTALLTFGALEAVGAKPGSTEWIELAALLALLVGAVRVVIGLARGGVIAYLLSHPVLEGFTSAASILIVASQIPTALGLPRGSGDTLKEAFNALSEPSTWNTGALGVAVLVIAAILIGPSIHRHLPAVPLSIAAGIALTHLTEYTAPLLGDVPTGVPTLSLDLPWSHAPTLLLPALIVALVGFAEPVSVARTYATTDRETWSPDQELVSQGAANLASGLFGGLPVGGSFSRSAVARETGGRTPWTGAIAGLAVVMFLPVADLLRDTPRAVLAGIIIASVIKLFRPDRLWKVAVVTPPQGIVGAITFAATLILAPRIDLAVLLGIGLAVLVHLWRELHLPIDISVEGSTMRVHPSGVLFFGSSQDFDDHVSDVVAGHDAVDHVIIDLTGIGRLDYTAALTLANLAIHLRSAGCTVELRNVNPAIERIIDRTWVPDAGDPGRH